MEKVSTKFEFKLKEELCVTTFEECGEEMTPSMRVIKKCADFIDRVYHSPDDTYEHMYAMAIQEPGDGTEETFATNYSYENKDGDYIGSYSYFVIYSHQDKKVKMDFTIRNKDPKYCVNVTKELEEHILHLLKR